MAVMVSDELSLIRLPEVLRRTGLSRTQTYSLSQQAKFPNHISLTGGRSSAWVSSEVDAWVHSRIAASRKAGEA